MEFLKPTVFALKLSGKRNGIWKFKSKMRDTTSLAERIWWVNKNTMIRTSVNDQSSCHVATPPPGITVFAPLTTKSHMNRVIHELNGLFKKERASPSLMGFHMSRARDVYILFYPEDSQDKSPPASEVIETLSGLTPCTVSLLKLFRQSISDLLNISLEVFNEKSTFGIIRYDKNAGIQTHIDNITRLGGSTGPVFTMSLGGSGVKLFDMFPVIQHWKTPVRILIPEGGVVLMDGAARLEWSHGVPDKDPTVRYTIIAQFKQISDIQVGYSKTFDFPIFSSVLPAADDD